MSLAYFQTIFKPIYLFNGNQWLRSPCSHYFPYYTYYYLLAISRGRSIRFLICKEICRPSSVKLQTHLKTAKCAYLRALQTFPLPPWSKHCFEKHSRLLIRKKFNVVKYQIVCNLYEINVTSQSLLWHRILTFKSLLLRCFLAPNRITLCCKIPQS